MTLDQEATEQLRCLIIDDEAPARDELRFLLSETTTTQVVGAAATAEEAAVLIDNVDYDICFIDIRMPGRSGLELAADLVARPIAIGKQRPQIIFTTAYPDHAVEAFELSAADYLLKPFDLDRLEQAIARVRDRTQPDKTRDAMVPKPDIEPSGNHQRLPIERGDHTVFVDESEIVVAAAARGYTYLHLANERVLVRYTLAELEERFSNSFYRVHRSYLANLNQLVELRAGYHGALVLVMNDVARTRIPVARRQANDLRRILGM